MKNKKIIIGIIVLILVIVVPTGFVAMKNFKQDKSYKEYVEKANTLVEEKKYDEAMEVLQKGKDIKSTDEINNKITLVQSYIDQMKLYQEATALVEAGKYDVAIDELNKVDSAAVGLKEQVEEKIKFCKSEIVKDKSKAVEQLLSENKFEEAYEIATDKVATSYISDSSIVLKSQIDKAKSSYEAEQERIKAEEARKAEEEKKKKQVINKDRAIELALEKVRAIYKSKGYTSKLMVMLDSAEECEIQGRKGYLVPVSEDHPDHIVTMNRVFVDKNTGELFNALNYFLRPELPNPIEPF